MKTDPERGLIMIRGAVPGAKGGWVLLRDAVKRALPEAAPKPGALPQGRRRGAKAVQDRKPELRRRRGRSAEGGSQE